MIYVMNCFSFLFFWNALVYGIVGLKARNEGLTIIEKNAKSVAKNKKIFATIIVVC